MQRLEPVVSYGRRPLRPWPARWTGVRAVLWQELGAARSWMEERVVWRLSHWQAGAGAGLIWEAAPEAA
jgi:hypothetical protein